MEIFTFLKDNKSEIISKWHKAILDTYPKEGGKFLFGNKNQFSNPIGYTVSAELPNIYDELISGMDSEKLRTSIENIIKIRAIQEFTTAEAIGFLHLLKNILKSDIEQNINDRDFIKGRVEFESRIEQAVNIAFDLYLEKKIKLVEIKLSEVKKRNQKMVERLNRKYGIKDDG